MPLVLTQAADSAPAAPVVPARGYFPDAELLHRHSDAKELLHRHPDAELLHRAALRSLHRELEAQVLDQEDQPGPAATARHVQVTRESRRALTNALTHAQRVRLHHVPQVFVVIYPSTRPHRHHCSRCDHHYIRCPRHLWFAKQDEVTHRADPKQVAAAYETFYEETRQRPRRT